MTKGENITVMATTYPVAELFDNCEAVFGVKREVLAGALHGSEQPAYTLDEVRRRISQFRKKEVR